MQLARKIEDQLDYVPTFNNMGYMSPTLDPIQSLFVETCLKDPDGRFLDIGCGFGVATLPLVNAGCYGIACDLDQRHLEVLKSRIPKEKQSHVTFMSGYFPKEICLQDESIDNVNFSMVLHFLPPPYDTESFYSHFSKLEKRRKALPYHK